MMPAIKLRHALLLGAAISLPMAALPVAHQAEASTHSGFVAPSSPQVLTRELHRRLADGKEIVSRRSYEIHFTREGSGWRVEGLLISSEVDAPPELAMLARIEKARKDEGLFPLHLDSAGMIIDQNGAADNAATDEARSLVAGSLERLSIAQGDRTVATDMVTRIATQSRATGGNWPSDLFHPAAPRRSDVQNMPLPGGKSGKTTVTLIAVGADNGLLGQFERHVVTEIEGSSRTSQEIWRLQPSSTR